jgi:hypothetical protein
MEQRTGRLSAFFKSGPVQFVGVAGLAVVVGMGFNTLVENGNSAPQPTTVSTQQETLGTNDVGTQSPGVVGTNAVDAPAQDATTAQGGHPVVDSATRDAKRMERPHVPQEPGSGVYAFDLGLYDWQTFAARTNDLAPLVTSDYADDYIRALPMAADRAAVLGTGPHKLLHNEEGKSLSPIYLAQHYHLNAEGLAVAVSDNPAYEHSPIRAVAKSPDLLGQAQTIGQNPDALRALVTEVHTTRMGPEKALAVDADLQRMNPTDLATYAMIAGETAYVMADITGGPKDKERAALLMMAGVTANYEASRTRGKNHDMPNNLEWKEQIASANAVARFEKMELAKLTDAFKGLQATEQPVSVAESGKGKATRAAEDMR